MSKTFTFERFDLRACACDECDEPVRPQSEFDGAWVRAEDAINREAVNADEIRTLKVRLKEEKPQWRCFHCDETFTDEAAARLHFGTSLMHSPACTIDVAEYRAMEARMKLYNEEDSDLHREIAGMQSTHRTALRREEEKGYARGLAAATAALLTLDKLKYTYTQGAELWEPPAGLSIPAPIGEYHEDFGPVVWWAADENALWLGEPAWIGTPSDSDWPGYHTHWTLHPQFPAVPARVPLCTACEGYGRYVDGNSGTESDGYAPNIVECDCADEERRPEHRVEKLREIPKPANVTPAPVPGAVGFRYFVPGDGAHDTKARA